MEEELRRQMDQLEKFTKVAVGRELKMKKMEEELAALKEELDKSSFTASF